MEKNEKKFEVEITKKPINHPLNIMYTHIEFLDEKEFLKLKRKIHKDKKNHYKLSILSGQKEPLLFTEKFKIQFNNFKNIFIIKKTIAQMQFENTKREYIHKKYFWPILIVTAILSAMIGILLGKLFNN